MEAEETTTGAMPETPETEIPEPTTEESSEVGRSPEEAIAKLQEVARKERESRKAKEREAKALKTRLEELEEKFQSVDPQEYARLKEIERQQAEWEEREAAIRAEAGSALEKERREVEAAKRETLELKRRILMDQLLAQSGGRPELADQFALVMDDKLLLAKDGQSLFVSGGDGKQRYDELGNAMAPDGFMESLKKMNTFAHFFQPTGRVGDGMMGSIDASGVDLAAMTPVERLDYLRKLKR